MLATKLACRSAIALAAFGLGMFASQVPGYLLNTVNELAPLSSRSSARIPPNAGDAADLYFLHPVTTALRICLANGGDLYPAGWHYYLPMSQIPPIKRVGRDGRWFFFETEYDNGRSFQFFGVVPDETNLDGLTIISGRLLRISDGQITGSFDATYFAPECFPR